MSLQRDLVSLTGTIVISTITFNFGLRTASRLNPELMEIIFASTKLERFAEAAGVYEPTAVPDTFEVLPESQSNFLDVLINDEVAFDLSLTFGGEANNEFNDQKQIGLHLITIDPLDSSAAIRVADYDPPIESGQNSAAADTDVTVNTYGRVEYSPAPGFVGEDQFRYTACDTSPENALPGDGYRFDDAQDCSSTLVTVNVRTPDLNLPPQVRDVPASNLAPEDGEVVFGAVLFRENFQDPNATLENSTQAQTLQEIQIVTLPLKGTLSVAAASTIQPQNLAETSGNVVAQGDILSLAQLETLRYTPDFQAQGLDSFQWIGSDGELFSTNSQDQVNPQGFGQVSTVTLDLDALARTLDTVVSNEVEIPALVGSNLPDLQIPASPATANPTTNTSEAVSSTDNPDSKKNSATPALIRTGGDVNG